MALPARYSLPRLRSFCAVGAGAAAQLAGAVWASAAAGPAHCRWASSGGEAVAPGGSDGGNNVSAETTPAAPAASSRGPSGASGQGPKGAAASQQQQRSSAAGAAAQQQGSAADEPHMDFPGGKVPFTAGLQFRGGSFSPRDPIPCYRTLDSGGAEVPGAALPHPLEEDKALEMYRTMVALQTVDTIFYEAQRQGRFSFYMTSSGEEATAVGSAAALSLDDVVFSQYREQGVLMWRGFSVLDMANQCFGNMHEQGKGRQMPIHYGSRELNFHTISSPLATQLPHAVGAAYCLKLDRKPAVAAAYFGEGAASEGDFHAALNFAATLSAPVLFICRNNGWAISTPATEQYRGDGIAGRGPSYGIATIRVDGGDARAMYNATAEARRIALEQTAPVLIEAMSYRSGHHSTSDDSSRYRASEEMRAWRARDPVGRFQRWLLGRGWWSEAREVELRQACRKEAIRALQAAQDVPKAPLSDLFTDVYDQLPPHLEEQRAELFDFVARHPDACPPDIPVK